MQGCSTERIKISVIVPVYKVEKYIDRCVKSLLQQSLKEIQIVLVDDGSPDRCGDICDRYAEKDQRIKVVHKENAGLGFARNTGMEYADGEYIAFVDSDDYISTDMLERLYRFASEENMDAVFCGFTVVTRDNKQMDRLEVRKITYFNNRKEREQYLLGMIGAEPEYPKDARFTMSVWRGIYKKEVIDAGQCMFPSERKVVSEDIIFHIQFLNYAERIAILPECYYYYCENQSSLTHTYRADRFEKVLNLIALIDQMMKEYGFQDPGNMNKDRLLLARSRSAIRQICYHQYVLGKKKADKEIYKIMSSPQLRRCIGEYRCAKLPFAQKCFFYAVKWKSVKGSKLLIRINDIRKKNGTIS